MVLPGTFVSRLISRLLFNFEHSGTCVYPNFSEPAPECYQEGRLLLSGSAPVAILTPSPPRRPHRFLTWSVPLLRSVHQLARSALRHPGGLRYLICVVSTTGVLEILSPSLPLFPSLLNEILNLKKIKYFSEV